MAFKALADMFFGNKIGFKKKERKQLITAKTQYTLLLLFLCFVLFLVLQNSGKGVIH